MTKEDILNELKLIISNPSGDYCIDSAGYIYSTGARVAGDYIDCAAPWDGDKHISLRWDLKLDLEGQSKETMSSLLKLLKRDNEV